MKSIALIGMGLSPHDLTPGHLELIRKAHILIAGRRHLEFFKDHGGLKKEIRGDLKALIEFIKGRMEKERIVVLASGDPLFYGIGALLIDSLGPDAVTVYPNISAVAAAFSRIKESWHDVLTISFHGRNPEQELLRSLAEADKIAVFTDPRHTPGYLAGLLLRQGKADFRMCVLEQMGTPQERIRWLAPAEAESCRFEEPNLVILKRIRTVSGSARLRLGIPEEDLEHEKGLITKAEVRAVVLSRLCLSADHVLWDLGAGSGSVSLEASLFIRRGRIFAVEQKRERVEQIERNRERFGVRNLEVIHATLPEGLGDLPQPDRIFLGGGGRNLAAILKKAAARLKPDGIVVANVVLMENVDTAVKSLNALGFRTDILQILVHRGRAMPWGTRLEAQNPVWIISGMRNGDASCGHPIP